MKIDTEEITKNKDVEVDIAFRSLSLNESSYLYGSVTLHVERDMFAA
jgi:hypothetical protein